MNAISIQYSAKDLEINPYAFPKMISDEREMNHSDKTTGFAGGSSSYAEATADRRFKVSNRFYVRRFEAFKLRYFLIDINLTPRPLES